MTGRRYLLVDDNAEFLENLAEILRDLGAEVDCAPDGEAALRAVAAARYDAVVTDMRMPGMSGAQLLHRLRALDGGVPVVLLSAFAQDAQVTDARRDGLLAVLSKPQQVPKLLSLLSRARRGGVVLVEDDAALCDNLAEVLAARGITVVTAGHVAEVDAIGVAPVAALVDLKVPGGDPGAALESVRRRFPGTPTVLITAFGDEAPSLGRAEVFHKPFDTGALVARIEELFAAMGRAPGPPEEPR